MTDYERIERAIRSIEQNFRAQPSLAEMAREAGLSEFHFQRLFTRWAGVSPKRFVQFLTAEYAKRLLEESRSVLAASYEAGLSGPSRLHDLLVTFDAVTPGEHRNGGVGVEVAYGVHDSPFGPAFVAATTRGICRLTFVDGDAGDELAALRARWPNASLAEDRAATALLARRAFAGANGTPLGLHLRGTNFQLQVWRALLDVPAAHLVSYGHVARAIGMPTAARAVGAAIGANPVAYLIPCHRVIREVGELGGYRWGTARKRALLGWEAARAEAATANVG